MLLIAVAVFTVGAMVYAGVFSPIAIVTGIIAVCCLLGGVALLRRSDSKGMERRSWNKYPNKGMTITYTFYKDHFEEEDARFRQARVSLPQHQKRQRGRRALLPLYQANAAHMLRKDGFVQGDPATFPAFLRKKAAVQMDLVD